MSTMSYALVDSVTMVRRQLKHMRRYPSLTLQLIGLPVLLLLLFAGVGHIVNPTPVQRDRDLERIHRRSPCPD